MGSTSCNSSNTYIYSYTNPNTLNSLVYCCNNPDLYAVKVWKCEEKLPGYEAVEVAKGFAAFFTFGLSTVVNGGIKSKTHDYVCIKFKCLSCKKTLLATFEHGDYSRGNNRFILADSNGGWVNNEKEIFVSAQKVAKIFNGMKSEYSLVNYNCGHWAYDFYSKIVNA